ncbi:hypothetical protein BDR05DRAFT_1001631 [Suillus weaverae]|nr:hypothetical protein BDR05DRAFT_1001631 [Suillus weaverae]
MSRLHIDGSGAGFFVQYAAQATGSMLVCNYMVNLYNDLGFTGGIMNILSAISVTVATTANFVAAIIMDYVGRARLLSIGLAGCMISLSLENAMKARLVGLTPHTGDALGVLFIFCFICIYACGIDATSYVYCSEIFPSYRRAPGMAFSMTGTFLSTVVFLEGYYVVFMCLTAVNLAAMLYFFPETTDLALEEINSKFGDTVAVHFQESVVDPDNSSGDRKADAES